MPFKRQTAKKVRIIDLVKGEWVKKEGMEPSYVVTPYGDSVSRARIIGTIVGKFIAEDEGFGSVTLDDATDTIRAKTFKTAKPIEGLEAGKLVEVIGKVREYNEEIYLIPEIITSINDPNMEILRRLEIYNLLRNKDSKALPEKKPSKDEKEEVRKRVIGILGESKDAIAFTDLIAKVGGKEDVIEKVIDDILAEGICYEPTPGKIKKI